MILNNNTLTSNTARQSGGDIFKTSDSSVIVQDSIFINTSPADFLINENIVLNDTNYIPESSQVQIYIDDEDKGTYQLNNKIIDGFTVPLGDYTIKLLVQGSNEDYSRNTYILNYDNLIKTQTNLTIINNTVGNTVVNITVQDENSELINNESVIITDKTGQIIAIGYINKTMNQQLD